MSHGLGILSNEPDREGCGHDQNWALAVSTLGWGPDVTTLTRCLENLKEKGDDDGAKEIEGLLEKQSKDSCTV